jgi:catechol 2,3-dioxygenase-like lactoylglutathione lyase family enzyme
MAGEKTVNDITFRIRHMMMLVSDLDRSIDFYTRLLGMDTQRIRLVPEKNERVGYLGYGSQDHVAFIQDPDGYVLELTERHSKSGPPLSR